MGQTLVAFHAHPDDEALLTSGTMARAAAEGHRVVLVVATDGGLGLAASELTENLGERRMGELQASAQALGTSRVETLGYADSGLGPDTPPDPPGRVRFVRADPEEAAQRLAALLREESADVLLTYDANGGYGHRDHVKVHQVGARAAELAGTPKVLQATVPRDLLVRAIHLAQRIYRFPPDFDEASFERAYSPSSAVTHRIGVRRYASHKRASMRAHASQATADGGADRTLAAFLRIPRPLFDLVFGREWFVDASRPPGKGVAHDVFE
ncbi:PIG-L family deacetylase [Lapillicoccus sp.]|uniref:PIG-L deacetylase family protein n=1 Tax=Lapillicoccus sp. TaxID=1909287 RepID=UPI00326711D0